MKRFWLICTMAMPVFVAGCNLISPHVAEKDATPEHDFRVYGEPDKGAFMVDAKTGLTWQYEETPDHIKAFVEVPVVERPEEAKGRVGVAPADLPPPGAHIVSYKDLK